MSESTVLPNSSAMYGPYGQGLRLPSNRYVETQFGSQGVNRPSHSPLNDFGSLKASLPHQNNPQLCLPSGRSMPLREFYPQNGLSNGGYPYMPPALLTGMVGNISYNPASVGAYDWQYNNLPIGSTGVDLNSVNHASWVSPNENVPINADAALGYNDEYNTTPQFTHPATTAGSQYTSGPVQAMKTHDNKGYEMVNLDELVSHPPAIPHAVPALWTNQEDLTLAKCLQNPEGITNVYIRGFMPDTTDEDLHRWSARFGQIESCKAIIDQDTGKCKGFGFVMYYNPAAAENCIRGFFHLGFQASYAQKSRNSRLKDLEDKSSTNIYCTGVPVDWNESHLAKHFLPFNAVSTKICRDSPSGVSKEVGFARFESREVAERVIREYHSAAVDHDQVKLYLRFADTKAQKQLKQQSQERRQWRSREYSYSVEHTPSPITGRTHDMAHLSPYGSNLSAGNNFTPATSVSPPEATNVKKVVNNVVTSTWPTSGGLQSITNKPTASSQAGPIIAVAPKTASTITVKKTSNESKATKTPSPKKVTIKIETASGKENINATPPTTN